MPVAFFTMHMLALGDDPAAVAERAKYTAKARELVNPTDAGPLEYAVAGRGPPLMMIHGTGGGFDQGLLFAHGLREAASRSSRRRASAICAAPFPTTPRPASGRCAGGACSTISALSAPARWRGVGRGADGGRIRPAPSRPLLASRPHRAGGEPDGARSGGVHRAAAHRGRAGAGSDFWFWALRDACARQLLRTLLATDPALLARVARRAAPRRPDPRRPDADQPQGRRACGPTGSGPARPRRRPSRHCRADADPVLRGRPLRHRGHRAPAGRPHPGARASSSIRTADTSGLATTPT
jgi:2-hydroxy-6-oxonona-2,4-dienedioate hydrolase